MKKIKLYTTIALAFSIWFLTAKVNAQVCFMPTDTVTKGYNPPCIITADFNKDGKVDLAAVYPSANIVSISFGMGTGSFGTTTNYSVGTNPAQLVKADFNGDGNIDLAVTNGGSNNISVLLGTGTGSFSVATNYAVGLAPSGITCADFNNDGKKDLAVANTGSFPSGSNNISILLGTGMGSFATAYTVLDYSNYAYRPMSITNADFNMDGNADLTITYQSNINPTNNVYISFGSGTGSFDTITTVPISARPNYVAAEDLNNDGKADIATTNSSSNIITVRLNSGNGSSFSITDYTVGSSPYSLAVADFNKDGLVDLAVNNSASATISVLLGAGSGNFNPVVNFSIGSAYNNEEIISADFNGDTMPDLAVASTDTYILLNCTTVGIEQFTNNPNIKVYPNPAQNNLTVEVADNEKQQLQVVDISGKTILFQIISGITNIDTSQLENGMYFVQLKNNEGISIKKIIVQH